MWLESVSVAVQTPAPPTQLRHRRACTAASLPCGGREISLDFPSPALRLAFCVASYFGNGVPRPAAAHIARRQRRARAYPRLEAGAERAGAVYPCGARQRRDRWVSVVEGRREILTPRSIDADGD